MKRAGTPAPDAVARALAAGPAWQGVTSTFAFDAQGDLPGKPVVMSVVRQGRFEFLAELGTTGLAQVASAEAR